MDDWINSSEEDDDEDEGASDKDDKRIHQSKTELKWDVGLYSEVSKSCGTATE